MNRDSRSGAVLIVVLIVLAGASFLILESVKVVRVDYASAAVARTRIVGGNLIESGLDLVSDMLLEDLSINGNRQDTLFEDWYLVDESLVDFNRAFRSGDLEIQVTGEDGRLSINALGGTGVVADGNGAIFLRLLEGLLSRHRIEADPKVFLASIRVWLGGTDPKQDGAWYGTREPPYARRQKPFLTTDDLLLVRWDGVDREDFLKIYHGADGIPGLKEFITTWGNGEINVNYARRELLAAIAHSSDGRESFVSNVEQYRGDGSNQFDNKWYADMATKAGLPPAGFPTGALSGKSQYFRVELAATVGGGVLRSTVILQRTDQKCVVLFKNMH